MINIFVSAEDGCTVVEDDQEVRSKVDCLCAFLNDDSVLASSVELGEAEQRLREYAQNWCEDLVEFEQKMLEFKEKINGKVGKFYEWGVEYDSDIMFVEEGEKLPTIVYDEESDTVRLVD